jgi:hypothetical protein
MKLIPFLIPVIFSLSYSMGNPHELFNPSYDGKVDTISAPSSRMILITTDYDSLIIDSIYIKNSNVDLLIVQFKLSGWIAKPADSIYSITDNNNNYGLQTGNNYITSPSLNFFYLDSFTVNSFSSVKQFANCLLVFHFKRIYKDSVISNYDTLTLISKYTPIINSIKIVNVKKITGNNNTYLLNGRKIKDINTKRLFRLTIKK